jgi:hypothetical protein
MTAVVPLRDVVDAMDMMGDEIHAYLNKETGELVSTMDEDIRAIENEENEDDFPEWQRESLAIARKVLDNPDYLALPDKFEIDEYRIMERFCYSVSDPELSGELMYQIKGRGAFRRFKDAIHHYGIEDKWYEFRNEAMEEIAIEWLESHGIPFSRDKDPEP